jgi:NADPH:quinone reductase-like Zn-dependent oxidoreductase
MSKLVRLTTVATEGDSMQAVVIHETGDPGVLRYEQAERPAPGEGEVLIRVSAASVNPADWKVRRGFMKTQLPAVLGFDVSGTIERSRAEGFAEGDEVFGRAASGAYAEYATAAAGLIAKKPAGVSHEQAAAIPVAGLTAWQGLFDRGGLERGQTALIAGAAGGVGHFAVQFARHAGARAIGTGSSHNRDFVLGLGAEQYVDYTQQDVAGAVSEVDVAFDTVGGETTQSLLPTVREGGTLVTIAGAPPEEAARERGVRAELLVSSPNSDQLARIAELVARGDVRVEMSEVLPLAEIRRAHELSESGHARGKIILTVGA